MISALMEGLLFTGGCALILLAVNVTLAAVAALGRWWRADPTEAPPYTLLYCDEWDHRDDEPISWARVVGTYDTVPEAMQALRQWRYRAGREWGPGVLVITDAMGRYVDTIEYVERIGRAA